VRQEDQEFKAGLGYRAKTCLKNNRKEIKKLDFKSHAAYHCKKALGR
jgi:hypothetical protein